MNVRALCFAACTYAALAVSSPAQAASIFVEDFEDGDAAGWAPSGGDVRLTQYAGNTSLRMSARSTVVAAASTRGYEGVSLSAALAASSLEGDEHCIVEVSADGGSTWTQVLRVANGQDDAITLHTGLLRHASLDNVGQLLIGARVAGSSDDDQCWLDNVRIAGEHQSEPPGPRTALGRDFLYGAGTLDSPTPMSAYAPSAEARAPRGRFVGTLAFDADMTGFRVHRDILGYDREPALQLRDLPPFAFALVQSGERLIPVQRGPIPSGHPSWEFALEPGRVWVEAGDGGISRAALPFALIETNANCTHYGVLTFLFGDGAEVSRVAWQIASETCAYLQFDAWGVAPARYTQGVANADAVVATDAAEQARRMPTRAFSALARDHPRVDLTAFASPADIDPRALTTYGLVVNGVHYLGSCDTRAGAHPFCESLLAPSYSLAKSAVAGLGLMRLELLHPGAMREPVAAHVSECRGWEGVTFEHALDMATGRYRSAEDQADESAMTGDRFFISTTHAEKISIACGLFPRREPPGRRWVYHTTDTYVLGSAMSEFWRRRHGASADFFNDVLVAGIYEPLGLSRASRATRRSSDEASQPFTGWGLTLTRDDIAKLGAYLVSGDQRPALVADAPLDAALQRVADDRGLPAGADTLRYNNGFWAYNAQHALNCPDPVWIPFMSGFGGVIVALMPNGVVYYYVSDGHDYAWARAVRAADAIAPLCPRAAR